MLQLTFRWPGSSSRTPSATLRARRFPEVDLDSRFGMLYDAARKAADAIMRAGGRRVTQGIGHHIVFFEEAKRLLPAADSGLVARVEGARNTRNAMEYQAREVTQTEVDELTNAATHFMVAARLYVQQAETS